MKFNFINKLSLLILFSILVVNQISYGQTPEEHCAAIKNNGLGGSELLAVDMSNSIYLVKYCKGGFFKVLTTSNLNYYINSSSGAYLTGFSTSRIQYGTNNGQIEFP